MKKRLLTLCSILPVILFTGCKEDGLLLNVNPDGSGTVVIRSYMNATAMEQMGGGGFPGGENGDGEITIDAPDPAEETKSQVESISKGLGELTLVAGKAVKNKAGWPGYEAVYRFEDVNNIKLTLSPPPVEDPDLAEFEGPGAGGGGDGAETPEYTIKFTPGSPARLELTAVIDPAQDAEAAARSEQEVQMEAKQMQMQAGMMAAMLAGMRSTIMVRVNGTVVESNADLTSSAGNNAFLLADMKMAEAMNDPAVVQLMTESKGALPSKTVNTKSLKLQNPRAPVVVTFK